MFAHDALDDHEAEAMAVGFGGVIRLKEAHEILLLDAAAAVAEEQVHGFIVGPRANLEPAARLHGVHGVFVNVKKDLFELIAVGHDWGQIGERVGFHRDAPIGKFPLLELQHLRQNFSQIELRQIGRTRADRIEEVTNDPIQPSDFSAANRHGLRERLRFFRSFEFLQLSLHELQMNRK